ncbi:inositol polyphosphate 1-phosphatase-like [Pecten maximus]|uniref:inositol polyphosphate 1-phosphatase-like n=1 Tax=Pecten maximus TaxID=6579 RepID=UPI0014582FB5|nr:inositol polyphosphate 1-phosphatase-like [Pecten maximus]XP_033762743.1 inositol polyphosphate 1-phosphatase-like [Pecten maximus]XP_033762744.1 inositol polyphosphate 1-phosphatase-like [Pecten maximus]XP_033762745.1 inositol polyphosphate 1-phosphatase-like [Pecten maximus]
MKVGVAEVLKLLVNTAEKGANVARIIRSDADLLNLLVEEKTGDSKNQRFVQDFKTLADVLVQEIVRHDLTEKIPDIKGSIYGEESNTFTNAVGESITVEIQATKQHTTDLLNKVLDGNKRAADLLAREAHESVAVDVGSGLEKLVGLEVNVEDIGVWIDPIDSTAQYIGGLHGTVENNGIASEGLQCVVVIIGVYDKRTGLPLVGVTNQPFSTFDTQSKRWIGETMWGVCVGDTRVNSFSKPPPVKPRDTPIILMSTSECQDIQTTFSKKCSLHYAAGAGYKLLCAIQGLADSYILSKSSTFKWDACGPHAILLSIGGGLISFKSLQDGDLQDSETLVRDLQIRYDKADRPGASGAEQWCNEGGIVAYTSTAMLKTIKEIIA